MTLFQFSIPLACILLFLQTNGLDERTNQTLKRSIGKTLDGQQERWEEQEFFFSNNCCVQASSRFSPYRLMNEREPRLFSEVCSGWLFHITILTISKSTFSLFREEFTLCMVWGDDLTVGNQHEKYIYVKIIILFLIGTYFIACPLPFFFLCYLRPLEIFQMICGHCFSR